jgi:ankyrin repeat protein
MGQPIPDTSDIRDDIFEDACMLYNLKMIKYLITIGFKPTVSSFLCMLNSGNLEMADVLIQNGVDINQADINNIVISDHKIAALRYALEKFTTYTAEDLSMLTNYAIQSNSLECLKLLISYGAHLPNNREFAIRLSTNINIIEYILRRESSHVSYMDKDYLKLAAENNNMCVTKAILRNTIPLSKGFVDTIVFPNRQMENLVRDYVYHKVMLTRRPS